MPVGAGLSPTSAGPQSTIVFEVEKRAREGIADSDYSTDDAYDLRGLVPVSVLGMRFGAGLSAGC